MNNLLEILVFSILAVLVYTGAFLIVMAIGSTLRTMSQGGVIDPTKYKKAFKISTITLLIGVLLVHGGLIFSEKIAEKLRDEEVSGLKIMIHLLIVLVLFAIIIRRRFMRIYKFFLE